MAKLTKKQKAQEGKVDSTKLYPLADALALVKEHATAKFDESIDVAVQLGTDAGGVLMMKVKLLSANAVITTGSGSPGSTPCVCALNALQNSMMFRPR